MCQDQETKSNISRIHKTDLKTEYQKNGQKSKNVHANLRLKTEAQSLTLDKDEDIDTSIR